MDARGFSSNEQDFPQDGVHILKGYKSYARHTTGTETVKLSRRARDCSRHLQPRYSSTTAISHAYQRLERTTQDNKHSLPSAASPIFLTTNSRTEQTGATSATTTNNLLFSSHADKVPAVLIKDIVGSLHATVHRLLRSPVNRRFQDQSPLQSPMEVPRGSHRRSGLQVLPVARQPFSGHGSFELFTRSSSLSQDTNEGKS